MHNHARYLVYLCLVSSLCAEAPLISEEHEALIINQENELVDNNADALSPEPKENLYPSYDAVGDYIPSLKTIAIGAGAVLTSRKLYGLLNEYIKSEDIAVEKPDASSDYTVKYFIITALSGVVIPLSVFLAKRKIEQKNLNEIFKQLKARYKAINAIKANPDKSSYMEQLVTLLVEIKAFTMSIQGTAERTELNKADLKLVHSLGMYSNTIILDLNDASKDE